MPNVEKGEGRLDFARDVNELERQVRAFNPWRRVYGVRWDTIESPSSHVKREMHQRAELVWLNQPAVAARGGTSRPG